MRKLKRWLFTRFLPAWCKEELLAENKRQAQVITAQKIEIDRLNAYIDGMEVTLRYQRRIIIQNGVKK